MIKIVDIDNLFDKYIEDYVMQNIGKLKPEQIENNIPILYEKFGKEACDDLDGFCPQEYYKNFDIKELLECLREHIKQGVSVSDYLCEAISHNEKNADEIRAQLSLENGEEYTSYLMNVLSDMSQTPPLKRYLEFVLYEESPTIIELATEALCGYASQVKDDVLSCFDTAPIERKQYLVEILSNSSKDEKVFDILIAEFMKNQDQVAIYAGYLAKYGDERAVAFLVKAIEDEKINYADFEELRFAIETLGGEYDKKRDFSTDKFYKQIVKQKN